MSWVSRFSSHALCAACAFATVFVSAPASAFATDARVPLRHYLRLQDTASDSATRPDDPAADPANDGAESPIDPDDAAALPEAEAGIPLWIDVHSGTLIDLFENPPGIDLGTPFGVSLELGGTIGWRLLPRRFTTPFVALSVSLMFTTMFYDDPITGTSKQDTTLGSKVAILVGVEFQGFNAFIDVGFRSHWSDLRTDGGIDVLQGDQSHEYLGIGFGYGDSGSDFRIVFAFPYNHGATDVTLQFEVHNSF